MIAIQKIGRSFSGALKYNLNKLNHPDKSKRAEVLGTNFASMNLAFINKEVELVKSLRPNLNRYVYHTSLNFPKEEQAQLSNEKLLAIALDYLEASGFSNNQYIIFRHHDSDHPHIHLLANRISFDGSVVSDSNNYKRSEAILRELEYRYNLMAVEQSNFVAVEHGINKTLELGSIRAKEQHISVAMQHRSPVSRKSPTRDEIAMILRTGKSSNKLLLQELLIHLFAEKPGSISQFISAGEKMGIYFLFNQASTGRVFGITYFFRDFKAKGQGLGNQFKWAELIKKVEYQQVRDSRLISEANNRTRAKYGKQVSEDAHTITPEPRGSDIDLISENLTGNLSEFGGLEGEDAAYEKKSLYTNRDVSSPGNHTNDFEFDSFGNLRGIEISDDIDDEAIHGRNRRRQKRARTNTR